MKIIRISTRLFKDYFKIIENIVLLGFGVLR